MKSIFNIFVALAVFSVLYTIYSLYNIIAMFVKKFEKEKFIIYGDNFVNSFVSMIICLVIACIIWNVGHLG